MLMLMMLMLMLMMLMLTMVPEKQPQLHYCSPLTN